MHCEACGTPARGTLWCGQCGATLGSGWILGLGLITWVTGLALFLVLSRIVYAEIERLYAGLGAQPPVLARLYFFLSDWLWPVAAGVAAATPIAAMIAGRSAPRRIRVWSRRYALFTLMGVVWALLGVAAWYLCVMAIIRTLS